MLCWRRHVRCVLMFVFARSGSCGFFKVCNICNCWRLCICLKVFFCLCWMPHVHSVVFLFRSFCTVATCFVFVFAIIAILGTSVDGAFFWNLNAIFVLKTKSWTWCVGGVTCAVFCVDLRSLCFLNFRKSWLFGLVQSLQHLQLLSIHDILFTSWQCRVGGVTSLINLHMQRSRSSKRFLLARGAS